MRLTFKLLALAALVLVLLPPLMWVAVAASFTVLPAWLLWGLWRGQTPAQRAQVQEEGEAMERAIQAFLMEHMLIDTPENRARILTVRRRRSRG